MKNASHQHGVLLSALLFSALLFSALLLSVTACGSSADTDASEKRATPPMRRPAAAWYGEDGELIASDLVIAGLSMPKGITPTLDKDRRHVFRTKAPLQKVLAYFGKRLKTPVAERKRQGVIFRNARPVGATGGVVLLDVSILPTSSGQVRIEVYEIPPAPQKPLSEQQVRKILQKQREQMQ